jgi:hypothetical protein
MKRNKEYIRVNYFEAYHDDDCDGEGMDGTG